MNSVPQSSLSQAEQAKLQQWRHTAAAMTILCGVGLMLTALGHRWLFGLYASPVSWLLDAVISGLVIALGVGIAKHHRWCLLGGSAVLALFLFNQLVQWAAFQQVNSFFLLVVPTVALLVNYRALRLWPAPEPVGEADKEPNK